MRKVIWEEGFRRALKRYLKKQPRLQAKVVVALQRLTENLFDTSLKTHKRKGESTGRWACTVEYDCRIIFCFQEIEGEPEAAIMAIDIGSHDDVY